MNSSVVDLLASSGVLIVIAENLIGMYYVLMLPVWATSKLLSSLFKLAVAILLICIGVACLAPYFSISISDALNVAKKYILPGLDRVYNILQSLIMSCWKYFT